ncbi:MAG TPA: hypothetical protein VKU39_11860, partial [Streptosporangiaceae bacterium]|nr:hypothetical protein [Streptosporangiaceae bacterium]
PHVLRQQEQLIPYNRTIRLSHMQSISKTWPARSQTRHRTRFCNSPNRRLVATTIGTGIRSLLNQFAGMRHAAHIGRSL